MGVEEASHPLEMVEPVEPAEARAPGTEKAADAPMLPAAPMRLQDGGGGDPTRLLLAPPHCRRLLLGPALPFSLSGGVGLAQCH